MFHVIYQFEMIKRLIFYYFRIITTTHNDFEDDFQL